MRPKEFEVSDAADAAMHVFWRRGYAATSIQDLVVGTGLSRSSLYGTFESKQALYEKALERYAAVTTSNVNLLSGPGSPKDLIRQLLVGVATSELKDPQRRGCLVANAALEVAGHDEAVAKLVTHNLQRLQAAIQALILRGQASGEIASTRDARALSHFIVNTMQGMRVLGKGTQASHRRSCLMGVIDVALDTL